MDVVWGKERVDQFKNWLTRDYIPTYEEKTGKALPSLEDSDIKHAGMLQFFGELTAFAAGQKTFEEYKRLTEDRARKGKVWQERNPEELYFKSPHASFPPGFPMDAWNYLESQK